MRKVIGVLFIMASFLGTIFLRRYNGNIIPLPILWYITFIVLGLTGAWLIYISARKAKRSFEQHTGSEVEKLKSNSEKIELNFDKCEFKSGSFSHEIDDPNMSAVRLFDTSSLASFDTKITETVIQSYLTYTETINGKACKFISQSFPFDQTTLKFHVLNHNIDLYVDRFNHERYLFDLKR